MTTGKITIKTGPPVEGDDFYGREKELQYAWYYHISKGTSLLLSAPRRVGKSSFAKKMLYLAEANGWKTMYLDLQGIYAESEFVKLIKKELIPSKWWNEAGEAFLKLLESIKLNVGNIDSNVWRNNTYAKIKQLIEKEDKMLIVIDELTIYLNHLLAQEKGKEKVEFFLEWLRNIRQTTKVRWIFCSSVGIENFTAMHQLSKHLNDLHSFLIDAFTELEAKDFITRLKVDEKTQFSEDNIQYILNKLVWYLPFFIQIIVEEINHIIVTDNQQLSNDTIDKAYNHLVSDSHFNTWDERLKEYGDLEDNAREMLKQCASSEGVSRDGFLAILTSKEGDLEIRKLETVVSKLLKMLQNDGYIIANNGNYIFRSPILRDFWHRRFIL